MYVRFEFREGETAMIRDAGTRINSTEREEHPDCQRRGSTRTASSQTSYPAARSIEKDS